MRERYVLALHGAESYFRLEFRCPEEGAARVGNDVTCAQFGSGIILFGNVSVPVSRKISIAIRTKGVIGGDTNETFIGGTLEIARNDLDSLRMLKFGVGAKPSTLMNGISNVRAG